VTPAFPPPDRQPSPTETAIRTALANGRRLSPGRIAQLTGTTYEGIRKTVKRMIDRGELASSGARGEMRCWLVTP